MKRCVIVGAAGISNYETVKKYLREDDYFIFCDGGLNHLHNLGVSPNLIVGDFDSHENPKLDIETIVLPCEKDDTDTVFALKEALKRGFDDFLIIGAVGGRLDHTIGNISMLVYLDSMNKRGMIIDDFSEMEIIPDGTAYIDDSFAFFSLLNVTGTAKDITVENAKYPLQSAEITCEYQYGVSNEVIPGKTARVRVGEGKLLLIKVF